MSVLENSGNAKLKGFYVRLEGAAELEAMFRELEQGAQKKILVPALKEVADLVLARVKARTPVSAGVKQRGIHLRDSWWIGEITKDRRQVGWRVMPGKRSTLGIPEDATGYYPTAVEYGYVKGGTVRATPMRIFGVDKRGRRYHRKVVRRVVEGGTRVPARPFLRPAVDSTRQDFSRILTAHIQRAFDRAAARKAV